MILCIRQKYISIAKNIFHKMCKLEKKFLVKY